MNVSLLIAAGAYYFFLDKKVTKNQDIGDASFAAQATIVLPDSSRSCSAVEHPSQTLPEGMALEIF